MNKENNQFDLIESFLNGDLPPHLMKEFQERIQHDPDFAEEVKWMKQFLFATQQSKAFDMLDTLKKVQQRRKILRRVLVGAAMVLLVGSSVFLARKYLVSPPIIENPNIVGNINQPTVPPPDQDTTSNTTGSQENLKNQVVPTPPEPPEDKGEEKLSTPKPIADWLTLVSHEEGVSVLGDTDSLQLALQMYDNDRQLEALPILERYLASEEEGNESFEIHVIVGKIYLLELKDFDKAQFHFEKVAHAQYSFDVDKNKAVFSLAILALKKEDLPTAKRLLQQLIDKEEIGQNIKDKAVETMDMCCNHMN